MSRSAPHKLQEVFSARRRRIGLTYGLTALENLIDLFYPFVIGVAINGLLLQQYQALVPLVGLWLFHTSCGYFRQRYDTRLFTEIFAEIASRTAIEQRAAGRATSEVAARTDMAEELVEFLEFDVPAAMLALFGLVGGVVMLSTYDPVAGLCMGALLLPATLIYWRYGHTALGIERRFNNRSEREVGLIAGGGAGQLRRHFRNLARWRVHASDAEAGAWSRLELIALLLFVALLMRLAQLPELMAGDIFAAVAYALRMLDALDSVPERVSAFSRMRDNIARLL